MPYDASPSSTHNPAAGGTPTAAWGDILNDNFAYIGAAWTAFTPTWTAVTTNPAIGNGTLTGAYRQFGKSLWVAFYIEAGSTTTFGSGEWILTLPNSLSSVAGRKQMLGGFIEDSSSANRYPIAGVINASATTVSRMASNASTGITATVPFTWAASDYLILEGILEVA